MMWMMGMMWTPFVWLCVATLAADGSHAGAAYEVKSLWNATWTDRLKHDLLMKYDKFARPAQHSDATHVQFGLVVKHVELDEMRSMMVLNAWTSLQWNDEKLVWNASDYGGIRRLTVADHEIWQPDVVLYNSALGNSLDHYGNTHCLVTSDGQVLWVPPSQFSAFCDLDMRKWPYDRHTCRFYFGSWVYDGEQVKLTRTPNSSAEGQVEMEACGWTVVRTEETEHVKYYECCSEPYYNVEVAVTVRRRSPAVALVVFTPAIACVALTLAIFWLPPGASEKFILSGVACIITSMFLIFFAHQLPMGTSLPYIVKFYSYTLVLVSLSVVVSVVSVGLGRRPRATPVPWIITRALSSRLAAVALLLPAKFGHQQQQQDCEELHERGLVDRSRTESVDTTAASNAIVGDHQYHLSLGQWQWALLATAVDRLFFLLYLLIFLFLSLAFYFS